MSIKLKFWLEVNKNLCNICNLLKDIREINKALAVGICYDFKNKEHSCTIEELN